MIVRLQWRSSFRYSQMPPVSPNGLHEKFGLALHVEGEDLEKFRAPLEKTKPVGTLDRALCIDPVAHGLRDLKRPAELRVHQRRCSFETRTPCLCAGSRALSASGMAPYNMFFGWRTIRHPPIAMTRQRPCGSHAHARTCRTRTAAALLRPPRQVWRALGVQRLRRVWQKAVQRYTTRWSAQACRCRMHLRGPQSSFSRASSQVSAHMRGVPHRKR